MTMSPASSSSELPPFFLGNVMRRYLATDLPNASAYLEHPASGASAIARPIIRHSLLGIGRLSAASTSFNGLETVAVNALENWPWFNCGSERSAQPDASLSSTKSVAIVAPVRSGVHVKLQQYRTLRDGWAHALALAPGDAAIDYAEKLNDEAERGGWAPKRRYASGDGEVGLVWDNDRAYADVGFWSDGSLVYYARSVSGEEVRGDLNPFDELPGTLLAILRSFA